MASPSDIYLPRTLPYPIKVVELHVSLDDDVRRGTRLLSYSYRAAGSSESSFGTWDAPVDGRIARWSVRVGSVLDGKRTLAVAIQEPCTHGVQIGGLCAICGKDVTSTDYTGYSDSARARIEMTHLAGGPTVSLEEAQRFERETAERLLKGRKLSLIVDLDQTVVHATVDPTVGEWIAEGEAWEQLSDDDRREREPNPNWDALRDVSRFTLPHDAPPHMRMLRSKDDGCMYYIKPRPGLAQFLAQISEKYEMHVYTMGTRSYAEKVCAAIDPTERLFGRRILSRDESGSLTAKSLERLFPCDTSMVVIIDDRSDVWDHSPNLVDVVRYDFFVGIGDINSAFLPPNTDPTLRIPRDAPTIARRPIGPQHRKEKDADDEEEDPDIDKIEDALWTKQAEVLEAQMEERPLAKMQHELEEHEEHAANGDAPGSKHHEKKAALLHNDDTELSRLQHILSEVHKRFFEQYDSRPSNNSRKPAGVVDVRKIISDFRAQTFTGMHFLFSSVIPLDVKPEESPIWRQAQRFGAICHSEVSPKLTHVITAKRSTAKVDTARRKGSANIVWVQWFIDSCSVWHAQEEKPYLVDADADRRYRERREQEVDASASSASDAMRTTPPTGEPDEEEAVMGAGFAEEELGTVDIDWAAINAEVDAAMNETDDDGDVDMGDDDDGDDDESRGSRTPHSNRLSSLRGSPRGYKRARSVDSNGTNGSVRGKRSRLREELVPDSSVPAPGDKEAGAEAEAEDEAEEEEDEEEEDDWDEDFLAQELGVES